MPQMGDLLQGFLFRKQEYEEEEEAQEQEKRQKLEDQLTELNFTKLQRDMERSAKDWEQQQKYYKALGELSPEEQKEVRFGIEPGEEERISVPTTPGYTRNPITGKIEYREPTVGRETGQSKFEKAFGDVRKYLELTQPEVGPATPSGMLDQQALDEAMKLVHPKMFGEEKKGEEKKTEYTGKELLGLGGVLEDTDFMGLADSLKTLGGERIRGEVFGAGEEHPEEDAIAQYKAKIDKWLEEGYEAKGIKMRIDQDKKKLETKDIDVNELYKYIGY